MFPPSWGISLYECIILHVTEGTSVGRSHRESIEQEEKNPDTFQSGQCWVIKAKGRDRLKKRGTVDYLGCA